MALFGNKTTEKDKKDKATAKTKPVVKTDKAPAKPADTSVSMKDLYGSGAAPAKADQAAVKKTGDPRAYRVLVKPLVTEKAGTLGTQNKYVFAVAIDANKIEVAKAVKEVYGVKPTKVNVVKLDGKKTRQGKTAGQRKDWKKAIVTLKAGETIKVYEGV